ncbi:hypothetical protein NRY68_11050 [Acidithiobacillus ferrooxidans]|uniref:hypothetical protein n=1 Tax=Acidithiobacillus ferrooxidans TaxID=920 RepID=UPI0021491CD9|nr:hypothetical protein [Acidithiobacillus ferrooxidans]MCR1346308.1 hypothetical protein [Acidithiobacillus ferrooxidans]MCR1354401.1 hypothetical protein [Acidithiobacillus ferrooxidans]
MLHVDAPQAQIQVIHMNQQETAVTLRGRIVKQGSGSNVTYMLRMPRKIRFAGTACPYAFTQNWLQISQYTDGPKYHATKGTHMYMAHLVCAMSGPGIERMYKIQ